MLVLKGLYNYSYVTEKYVRLSNNTKRRLFFTYHGYLCQHLRSRFLYNSTIFWIFIYVVSCANASNKFSGKTIAPMKNMQVYHCNNRHITLISVSILRYTCQNYQKQCVGNETFVTRTDRHIKQAKNNNLMRFINVCQAWILSFFLA